IKPIEAMEPGDWVWAWDHRSNRAVKRRVTRLFRHARKPVVDVRCVDDRGRSIDVACTTEHPFWVVGRGWVPAAKLPLQARLQSLESDLEIRVVLVEHRAERKEVFNFEVEGLHNYFVGAAGILVHNMSELPDDAPDSGRHALLPEPPVARSDHPGGG